MKPPWYGGNKIPASYLAKFLPPKQHEGVSDELRRFLDQLGDTPHGTHKTDTIAV